MREETKKIVQLEDDGYEREYEVKEVYDDSGNLIAKHFKVISETLKKERKPRLEDFKDDLLRLIAYAKKQGWI